MNISFKLFSLTIRAILEGDIEEFDHYLSSLFLARMASPLRSSYRLHGHMGSLLLRYNLIQRVIVDSSKLESCLRKELSFVLFYQENIFV